MTNPIIYCIEGLYQYPGKSITVQEPSVQPLLEYLQRNQLYTYMHRSCSTIGELRSLLKIEWMDLPKGSILYFSCHGSAGCLYFCDDEPVTLDQLGQYVDLSTCMVHFGSCGVLNLQKSAVKKFMKDTRATIITGYGDEEVGWTNTFHRPAGALELMLFSTIAEERINIALRRNSSKHLENLNELKTSLQQRFPDCGFQMYTK